MPPVVHRDRRPMLPSHRASGIHVNNQRPTGSDGAEHDGLVGGPGTQLWKVAAQACHPAPRANDSGRSFGAREMSAVASAVDDELYFVERDAEQLLALRARVWGADHPHTDRRFLAWSFAGTPKGAASGVMVRFKGRAIGFAGMCHKRHYVAGREMVFAHGMDYMIEPGLSDVLAGRVALRVPLRWHDLARANGCTTGVVFPNIKSMRILTSQRVGMMPLFQPDLLVRPLLSAKFTERLHNIPRRALSTATRIAAIASWGLASTYGRPTGELQEVDRFDPGFDDLWIRTRDSLGIATVRDSAYLNWRFNSHPVYPYRILGWKQGDQWMGYVVCTERKLFGVDAMLVVDILTPRMDSVGAALMDAVVDDARRRGMGMVVTLALPKSEVQEVLSGRGFIQVPARLDPKRFMAVERVYDETIRADVGSKPRYFTWSDMDVV